MATTATTTTTDVRRLESTTTDFSQRLRGQDSAARSANAIGDPELERQKLFFKFMHSQMNGDGKAADGDEKAVSQRKGPNTSQSANEPLPTYSKTAMAETYADCGCVDNASPARKFFKWALGKPEYLVDKTSDIPGVHIPNPLHVEYDDKGMPYQKLSTRINQAKKEAKKSRKEAKKTKKVAEKSGKKALKVQRKALKVRGTINDARDVSQKAVAEASLARERHAGAMRWTTVVSRDAENIHHETMDTLAEARQLSKNSNYCNHALV
ncbi:hypothetical protein PHISP_01629 [Aspergillus sp. HF37]|nr:hypothetical protein PHISP_01629 [Aspergillus sp. HF37]